MRQIATSAGVSPGLVLHHFGSEEGCVRAWTRWRSGHGCAGADPAVRATFLLVDNLAVLLRIIGQRCSAPIRCRARTWRAGLAKCS